VHTEATFQCRIWTFADLLAKKCARSNVLLLLLLLPNGAANLPGEPSLKIVAQQTWPDHAKFLLLPLLLPVLTGLVDLKPGSLLLL